MERFESPRQKKINSVLQKEIASLLLESIRSENISNLINHRGPDDHGFHYYKKNDLNFKCL